MRMHPLARLDHRYLWHPFTQMRDWLRHEPIVIVSGRGATLRDARGREYLDANASIWTNLHGHNHPALNTALRRQLGRIAHSSSLGLANEPAALLGARLVTAARPPRPERDKPKLGRVFFSDNGSTAVEVALKLAYEFSRRSRGERKPRFLSMQGAYHGDTVGAVSLGHIDLFHRGYAGLLFKSDAVMAPYCYRCPFNRARPERADARTWRVCRWECVTQVEAAFARRQKAGRSYAAFVYEPLIQGAAGMIPQPSGWLARVAAVARDHQTLLIADEVMTGFGRTCTSAHDGEAPPFDAPNRPASTSPSRPSPRPHTAASRADARTVPPLFASHRAGVQPDFLCLAKGLTGGYLPMAATLTTQEVFNAFLGEYEEFRTFFHGHSYTGNQLGAAAALASLDLLQSRPSQEQRLRLQRGLHDELAGLWSLPQVGDIRQVGLVAGIELVRNWRTREPFDLHERAGQRVCEAMAARGVLTRPIGNVVVLMPPFCTTGPQVRRTVTALHDAIAESFPSK